jgi:hypothetical protein
MSEKIYIIEKIFCRGEESIDKYSFDKEMFFSLLDLFSEDCRDLEDGKEEEITAKIREISKVDNYVIETLLYNLLFGMDDFCGDDLSFEERVQAIKNGKYCAELEESLIAVGFSAKEAKANLVELEEDEDW